VIQGGGDDHAGWADLLEQFIIRNTAVSKQKAGLTAAMPGGFEVHSPSRTADTCPRRSYLLVPT
jgi:hypothetical protein